MSYTNNMWLEKYEIKKPDYELRARERMDAWEEKGFPVRYEKTGDLWSSKDKGPADSVRIMFTGDITCFEKQFEEAAQGDGYDFSYQLEQVRPVFAQADLVVGNLETMIVPEAPYRSEKYVNEQNFHCNAPPEFLDALRKAGFDVLTNANNHDLDTGAVGIGRTIDYVERFGFIQTGTFKSEKKRYELIDVKGFKVAIVAFATQHNGKHENLTDEGAAFLLNDYSEKRANELIKQARKDGAEIVFCCIHWGVEHKLLHSRTQVEIAQQLTRMGYDCIIGSHPHVLQPFRYVRSGENSVPVFYSMGNFLSHNTAGPKSLSIIACVDLVREDGDVNLSCSYIPIHTSKDFGKKKFVVLPIPEKAIDPRNNRKKKRIAETMEGQIPVNTELSVSESVEKVDLLKERSVPQKLDLAKVTDFPVLYDDQRFLYQVYQEYAVCVGVSEKNTFQSHTLPDQVLGLPVSNVEAGAFAGNPTIMKINFRRNLKVVSERMFKDNPKLEGFQLASTTKAVETEAFSGCVSLACAVLRNPVERIGSKAFYGCKSLRSVKLGKSVNEIADDAFEGCENAVFYCAKDSYGEKFAKTHSFTVIQMEIT